MKLSIIAAVASNGVIGNNGKLPWDLPDDLIHFRRKTNGFPVIMGRKTFESIGKPLSGRENIIVTRNLDYKQEGCIVVHSLDEAIIAAQHRSEAFVIGGESLYEEALTCADMLYLTQINKDFYGDTYFPASYNDMFKMHDTTFYMNSPCNDFGFKFSEYVRKD